MLLTLWRAGYVELEPRPKLESEEEASDRQAAPPQPTLISNPLEPKKDAPKEQPKIELPTTARLTERARYLSRAMDARGVLPVVDQRGAHRLDDLVGRSRGGVAVEVDGGHAGV